MSREPAAVRPRSLARFPDRAEPARGRTVYLHPGELLAAREPVTVTTILGSCVAVCLWDTGRGVGGISHYLLPHHIGPGRVSLRFGTAAIGRLIAELVAVGGRKAQFAAKVFGGACVIAGVRQDENHLGHKNARLAADLLGAEGIPIVEIDVGGSRARKLIFHTDDGAALVRLI